MLQLATHATLHKVHPRAVAASVVVQDVSKHVVNAHPNFWLYGEEQLRELVHCVLFLATL